MTIILFINRLMPLNPFVHNKSEDFDEKGGEDLVPVMIPHIVLIRFLGIDDILLNEFLEAC
jgi:hypothetical protein